MTESSTTNFLALHPFVRQVVVDRIRGAVVGSALGDCIGLYTEFLDKSMIQASYPNDNFTLTGKITPFCNDSHRNKFTEGSWTDDTDHALLIILSFLHTDGKVLSSIDFAQRLRTWSEQGLRCLDRLPLGLGRTVGSVLNSKDFVDKSPTAAAFRHWANSNFSIAPNGSLMRTYPLGIICLDKSTSECFDIAAEFSRTTHVDPRCVVSCCIATAIIRGLLRGEVQTEKDINVLVDEAADFVEALPTLSASQFSSDQNWILNSDSPSPPPFDRNKLYFHTRATTYADLRLDDLREQGYVYKCLGSSILCLRLAMRSIHVKGSAKSIPISAQPIFESLITELVMQGGDADTNAVVAGAFVGCLLGYSILPSHWYEGVQNIDWLQAKSDALIQVLGIDDRAPSYIGSKDPDTSKDGGRGFLNQKELEAREYKFMEMYLTKTGLKSKANVAAASSEGGGLKKIWKSVIGSS